MDVDETRDEYVARFRALAHQEVAALFVPSRIPGLAGGHLDRFTVEDVTDAGQARDVRDAGEAGDADQAGEARATARAGHEQTPAGAVTEFSFRGHRFRYERRIWPPDFPLPIKVSLYVEHLRERVLTRRYTPGPDPEAVIRL
jgi:hypothetical protein